MNRYDNRLRILTEEYETLISRENKRIRSNNGIFERYKYPILTAAHTPLEWRYDFNPETNPFLMERFGINAVFNAGAIKYNGKYLIMARVEGYDRKSFFAIAESPNGIDNFRFWEYPIQLPDLYPEETNVYDMRLTQHEDGWIRHFLFGKQRSGRSRRRSDFCRCGSRHHTHQGLKKLGASA